MLSRILSGISCNRQSSSSSFGIAPLACRKKGTGCFYSRAVIPPVESSYRLPSNLRSLANRRFLHLREMVLLVPLMKESMFLHRSTR